MPVLLPDFKGVMDFLLSKKSKKDASRTILIIMILFQLVVCKNRATGTTGTEVPKMKKRLQNGRDGSLLTTSRRVDLD
jgi:hypothetical protein